MALSTLKSLLTVILFTLLVKGHGECALKDITVGTERTSREIQGKQEWKAMFINTCNCPQEGLIVSCEGFQTVEQVDPNDFVPIGDNKCSVNGGRLIPPFGRVEFLYAWDPPFLFVPLSSQVRC